MLDGSFDTTVNWADLTGFSLSGDVVAVELVFGEAHTPDVRQEPGGNDQLGGNQTSLDSEAKGCSSTLAVSGIGVSVLLLTSAETVMAIRKKKD